MKASEFTFQVIEPTYDYKNAYLQMCNDYICNNDTHYTYSTIEEVKKKIASDIKYSHDEIPLNRVKSFSYWFIINECIIGTSRLRPVFK